MENQSVRLWTKDFVLILLINFFIFLNHLMVLSTFPFYIEYLRGTEAVAGLAAAGFSFVAVFFRPFIAWFLDNGRRRLILVLGLLGMALTPLGYISVSLVVSAVILRMIHGVALGCAAPIPLPTPWPPICCPASASGRGWVISARPSPWPPPGRPSSPWRS